MIEFKFGDKVKLLPGASGSKGSFTGTPKDLLDHLGLIPYDSVFTVTAFDVDEGDYCLTTHGSIIWVLPEYLTFAGSSEKVIPESKIRRAIDFLEVDWESVDIDRVLKLAKELV